MSHSFSLNFFHAFFQFLEVFIILYTFTQGCALPTLINNTSEHLLLLPAACEDQASWCPTVHAGQCYSVLDVCCNTCALAQTNVQGLHSSLLFIHSTGTLR